MYDQHVLAYRALVPMEMWERMVRNHDPAYAGSQEATVRANGKIAYEAICKAARLLPRHETTRIWLARCKRACPKIEEALRLHRLFIVNTYGEEAPDAPAIPLGPLAEAFVAEVSTFNFGNLFSMIDGLRNQAVQHFERIVAQALALTDEQAVSLWIAHVRQGGLGFHNEERLATAFAKSLRQERRKAEAATRPAAEQRPPRTIEVPSEAGLPQRGTNWGKARTEHLKGYSQQEWSDDIADLVKRLKAVSVWYDRHEGSRYDTVGWIDSATRSADSHLESKRRYLLKIRAEHRDLSRQMMHGTEIDTRRLLELEQLEQAIIRSGLMLRDALDAHHAARGDIYAYCGMSMSTFRSWSQMKGDKDQYRKLKYAVIDSKKLLGLTPEEYEVWLRINGRTPEGVQADQPEDSPTADGVGGVDALPDEQIAGNIRDVANVVERNRRQAAINAAEEKGYRRAKARAIPKKGVDFEASGKRGSRFERLKQSQK